MINDELCTFVTFLGRCHLHAANRGCSGLVVRERDGIISATALKTLLQSEIAVCLLCYTRDTNEDQLEERLWQTFNAGYWVLLDISRSPSRRLTQQLELINSTHKMLLAEFSRRSRHEREIPPECGLIAFAAREFIEREVRYTRFYSLFGPIISV